MANGTIAFDTLQTSGQISGTAKSVDTDYLASGICTCWILFNQDTPAITDSFNVASVEDNSTGNLLPTFSTNMGNTTYVGHVGYEPEASLASNTAYVDSRATNRFRSTTAENGSNRDIAASSTAIHGDLA